MQKVFARCVLLCLVTVAVLINVWLTTIDLLNYRRKTWSKPLSIAAAGTRMFPVPRTTERQSDSKAEGTGENISLWASQPIGNMSSQSSISKALEVSRTIVATTKTFMDRHMQADQIADKGREADSQTEKANLSHRLTMIMATSPRPAGRCILHISSTLRNLYRKVPDLRTVTLRIAFDGCPEGKPQFWEHAWCTDYVWQKEAIRNLVQREFANMKIQFDYIPNSTRAGLSGNLLNAIQHVSTPFVYIIQDDFVHNADFNVSEVLDTLEANSAIEYIRLNVLKNGEVGLWDYKSDEIIIGNGKHYVQKGLTRGCNWSDNNHFVPTNVHLKLLTSMEKKDAAPESAFPHSVDSCQTQMRWYVYGALGHPPMICHVDGMYRTWNNGMNGPQKRECPTEEAYKQYVAKECPMSGLTSSGYP